MQENYFPTSAIVTYKRDIFGWTDHQEKLYHEGLVDSESGVAFERCLVALKPIWDEREAEAFSTHKSYTPKFFEWFVGRKGKPAKKKRPYQEPPSDGNRVPFSPPSQVPFLPPS